MRFAVPVFAFILLASCGSAPEKSKPSATIPSGSWTPPAAGTEVARYQEKIHGDNLNESYFKVVIRSTENSAKGAYTARLDYGQNSNETAIELPQWHNGVIVKPVLKKADGDYHLLLGFDTGDGQFHELYEISVENKNIRLKQTTGYYPSKS